MSLILLSNGPKEDACHASSPLPFSFIKDRAGSEAREVGAARESLLDSEKQVGHFSSEKVG